MKTGEFKMPCDFCSSEYPASQGIYEGKKLRGYEAWVCKVCDHAGDGGWNQFYEPMVLRFLEREEKEIPTRMSNGFLPKEFFK